MGDGGLHTQLKRKHQEIVREVRIGEEFTVHSGPEADRVRIAETQRLKDLRLAGTKGTIPKCGQKRYGIESSRHRVVASDADRLATSPTSAVPLLRSGRNPASGLEEVLIVEDGPRRSPRIRVA